MGNVVTSYSFTEEEIEDGFHIIVADDDQYGYEVTLQGDDAEMFSISLAYHEWSRDLALALADVISEYVDNAFDKEDAINDLWKLEYKDVYYEEDKTFTDEAEGNIETLLEFIQDMDIAIYEELSNTYGVDRIMKEAQTV